ncbi:MAG TPA: hypothetical protein VF776_05145 [Sphingomicrobium sp.]
MINGMLMRSFEGRLVLRRVDQNKQANGGCVENGQGGGSQARSCEGLSRRLEEALRKLESASALISRSIRDELAGSKDRDRLDRLYAVKGGMTCAIEEARNRLQSVRDEARKFMIARAERRR